MRSVLPAAVALLVLSAACSSSDDAGEPAGGSSGKPSPTTASPSEPTPTSPTTSPTPSPTTSGAPSTTLTVHAATSLTRPFRTLGRRFEASHPGVRVRIRFGGSDDLVTRLGRGAAGDVLATGDAVSMDTATGDGLVAGDPVPFASDALEIAVPPGNPGGVRSLRDLARPGTRTVLCATSLPCGAAAHTLQLSTGTRIDPVAEPATVDEVLDALAGGEADAALLHVTDVQAAGSTVEGIAVPQADQALDVYPVATLRGARQPALAHQFVALVTGSAGRAALRAAGFAGP